MWMEEKLGTRINQERMKEIDATPCDSVGMSCPFCMIMLGNAKEEIGATTKPYDVLELARRAMDTESSPSPSAGEREGSPLA
jgi:Fe-S oxidoreductase